MILKWTAAWYELEQTIIVGDKDWFYLPSDDNNHSFLMNFIRATLSYAKHWRLKR